MNLEMQNKVEQVRLALQETGASVVRLRGVDWFAWTTAGGNSAVLQTVEEGCAEVVITPGEVFVLTDNIEKPRLQAEQLPAGVEVVAVPWTDPQMRETVIHERSGGGSVLSDRPRAGETPLPECLWEQRLTLCPEEIDRYRRLGREAARAVNLALQEAHFDWTELQVSGAVSDHLRSAGCDVGLVQVAGTKRLPLYRHVPATGEQLGGHFMVSVCARKWGLWVSFTRFRASEDLPATSWSALAAVEHVAKRLYQETRPGVTLAQLYGVLQGAYAAVGFPEAIFDHHQGGPTGYACREALIHPHDHRVLQGNMALAFNPSVPSGKVEETVLLLEDGTLEMLTVDPSWPSAVSPLPHVAQVWTSEPVKGSSS